MVESDLLNTDEQLRKSFGNISVVNRDSIERILKEIDRDELIDEKALHLVMNDTNKFVYDVVKSTCELTESLDQDILSWKHLASVLENKYNIVIPGYSTSIDYLSTSNVNSIRNNNQK